MEQKKNFEAEVKELIPAIGFIKTRKLESVAMDMAENLQKEAEKKGYLLLETFVDRDGSRDIDREQLDEIMGQELVHDLFVRNIEDIAISLSDQLAFVRYADDHNVHIHVTDAAWEASRKVWDGGAGC